jgi:hypothetical protein
MMLATNTPAADQIVCTEYSDYYQNVTKRQFQDDSSLAYIARTAPMQATAWAIPQIGQMPFSRRNRKLACLKPKRTSVCNVSTA